MSSSRQQLKQTRSSSLNRIICYVFLAGCVLGAACFVYVYGVKILNPVYDAWLFNAENDLRQHYVGFCNFRNDNWQFPFGLTSSLSYPTSVSIIYTDSIPVFAVLFKLFSGILPVHFQYFGLFGLISFMLQGGFSAILIFRFLYKDSRKKNPWFSGIISVMLSLIFILSFTVLQRMFYHTALSAQWIILLAMNLFVYGEELSYKNRLIYWSVLGFLVIGIHSYFLPMVGILLLASCVDISVRSSWNIRTLAKEAMLILAYCFTALFNLYILGGFYGNVSAGGDGLGTFESNLNTFINPLRDSAIFKGLPLYYDFQYEGFAYIGLGCIVLLIISVFAGIAALIYCKIKKLSVINGIFTNHYRAVITFCVFVGCMMLASFPIVTFNDKKLFGVPYPEGLKNLLSIFRSNGRFVWVSMYILILAVIVITGRVINCIFSGKKGLLFMALVYTCVIALQMVDLSYMIGYKQDYFKTVQTYENPWVGTVVDKNYARYKEFAFLYTDHDLTIDSAYYGYLRGLVTNNYYFARDYSTEIKKDVDSFRHELKNGIVHEDVVYICDKDDDIVNQCKELTWFEIMDHYAGVLDIE